MDVLAPTILKLDVAGQPLGWINYERAAYYYETDKVAYTLGDVYTLHGGVNAMTEQRTTLDIRNIIAVNSKSKVRHIGAPTLTNRALFARDKKICAYCTHGHQHVAADLTRDHVHPTSKGGKDVWENVVTSCFRCNNMKGDRLLKDIPNMHMLYVPYKPDHAEALILKNRRILADQMEYLMDFVKNKDSRLVA